MKVIFSKTCLQGRWWMARDAPYQTVVCTDYFTSYCFLMLVKRVSFATILLAKSSFKASALVNSWSWRPSSACRNACWDTNEASTDGELSSHSAGGDAEHVASYKVNSNKVNLLLKRTCHKRTKSQTKDEKNMDILFFFLIDLDRKRWQMHQTWDDHKTS